MKRSKLETYTIQHLAESYEAISKFRMLGLDEGMFRFQQDAITFILTYVQQYSQPPGREVLEEEHPEVYQIDGKLPSLDFLLDEMVALRNSEIVRTTLEKGIRMLEEDTPRAIAHIQQGLSRVMAIGQMGIAATDRDAVFRYEGYMKRFEQSNKGALLGIPTGISKLDDLGGWFPGELISIIGRTGIGKSWMGLYFGIVAYECEYRVLFISPEMSLEQVHQRWDCLRGKFSATGLATGKGVDSVSYQKFLRRSGKRSDWITCDSSLDNPLTVGNIEALINQYQPKLVVVDGVPLLSDELKATSSWEIVKNIGYGLKRVASHCQVVMLATSQATRSAKDTTQAPKLHEISYGDALAQASDKVISLFAPESENAKDGKDMRYMKLIKNRSGPEINHRLAIVFQPHKGIISAKKQETS